MAISILIRFPISTQQYEDKYMLGIEMDYKATLQASIENDGGYVPNSALTTENVIVYDGMLNGDTVIQTDGRDNLFDPLVTSKLKFNIVSHEFPSWLLEATNYYTDVRCCLAVLGTKDNWICEWRGYIWGNTLNSTVVNDWIVTPVFALDELSMSKYIKIYNTLSEYGKSRRLWNYFAFYKSFNDSYFSHIYTWMGLNPTDTIYVDSPYCLKNENGDALPDFLNELWLDCYMYVNQEEDEDKKSFCDLFTDVCKFLGLTFMVGGRGESPKDSYLLESPDYRFRNENYERIWHDNETPASIFSATTGEWTGIVPNEKVGASFNITMEPMKYKGVKVTSEAKRYEGHEFLEDDNLEYYNKSKYVLHRWGNPSINESTIANYCIENPLFHKLYYMHPTTSEKEYMSVSAVNATSATCHNLMGLINLGYIQADLDAQNYNYPHSANTLSYILTKTGAVIVKTGYFDVREETEDENLSNYLLLMNHKWFNAGWLDDSWAGMINTAEEALTGNFNEAVELHPFGHHQIRHNQEQHWLKMDYSLICANENIGNLDRFTTTSPYHVDDMRGSEALAMPVTTNDYDYADESNTYGSKVGSYDESGNIQGYAPILRWKAKIGEYELTDRGHWVLPSATGFTREYNVNNFPENMSKTVRPASADTFGYAFCPYYTELHPKSAGGKKDMLIDVFNYGGPSYPLDGETTLKILNPSICFDWKSGKIGYLNNIYFLMSDIKFSFTDMAEIMGEDMVYETGDVFDTTSKTKEIYKTDFNLCSPKFDGLFYNALQYTYENGKYIANARNFYKQTNLVQSRNMEDWNVAYYCELLAPNPMTINLQMRYKAINDEGILFNNHVYIEDMTETPFTFQVRERTIVVNKNIVKFKADRVYDNVWSKMENPPKEEEELPVDKNDYNQ